MTKRFLSVLLSFCMVLGMLPTSAFAAEGEPTQTETVLTQEVSGTAAGSESVTQTEPAQTEPAQTEPVQTEPAQTEPAQTEPAQTEPAQTEPAQTEPAQTEPILDLRQASGQVGRICILSRQQGLDVCRCHSSC